MAKRPRKPYPPWRGEAGGGPDVWRKLAGARLGLNAAVSGDLSALGLTAMPATIEELKRAYRKAMLAAHPDLGGSDEAASKTSLAYARLLKSMEEKK